MLPADLLMQRYQGEAVIPKRLPCSADNLAIAAELIALFQAATGGTRAELQAQLMRDAFPRLARVRTTMQILEMLKP